MPRTKLSARPTLEECQALTDSEVDSLLPSQRRTYDRIVQQARMAAAAKKVQA